MMEEKDWFWQEDSYKLDAESPLAISRSLWDGLAQSEADSRSLFASTPPTSEHADSSRMLSSSYKKGALTVSLLSCNDFGPRSNLSELDADRDVYSDTTMQEGSPRLKRRRMLLFPASGDESSPCDPSMDTSMECMETHAENCDGSTMSSCEDFERFEVPVPSSPNSLWFLRNDESHFIVDEALEQPAPEKWMSRCFVEIQGGHQQVVPVSEISGMSSTGSCSVNQQQECEFEFSECPSTSFGGPSTPGSRSAVQHAKPKSVTPVAYPFNLLKPSRAQGDVTLTDINQRLSMPPSRPSRFSVDKRLVQTGAGGLSGKSVVHRTKIHTQGDGCITIMRTRG